MVSAKPDAQYLIRALSFDDDKVPVFFQSGFQLGPLIALIDAGV